MTDPAVGYTSGDDRKAFTAGDEMSGPLAWTSAADAHIVEAKVTGDSVDRFTIENDGTLEWGPGSGAADVNLFRGASNVLRTDDQLHLAGTGSVKFGSSGDVDITRTGTGELTLDGDLVVTGTITGGDPEDTDLTATSLTSSGPITATNVTGSGTVQGATVTATGNVTGVNMTASGDITAGDDLVVTDDATIGGDLAVTGALTIGGVVAATQTYVTDRTPLSIRVGAPTGVAATDTSAIQAALDAAYTAGGGRVVLGPGTYILSAPGTASDGALRVKDNTALVGMGIGATTLKMANATSANTTGIVRTVSGSVNKRILIADLTIDGNKANKSGTPDIIGFYAGVTPQNTSTDEDIVCERVEVKNCTDYGFDPHERVTRLRFSGCVSHDNDVDGFTLDGVYDFSVVDCVAYSNGRHGFNFVTGSARGRISACEAYSNTSNGFYAQNGAKHLTFNACRAYNNTGSGFVLNGVAQTAPELDTVAGGNHTLTGCTATLNGLHGFQLVGCSNNTLIGCRAMDNSATATNTSSHFRIAESGVIYSTGNTLLGCTWAQTAGVTNAAKYGIDEQSANDGPTYATGCSGAGTGTADLHFLNTTSSLLAAHNGSSGAHPATFAYAFDSPSKHGYVEWNYDPTSVSGATSAAAALTAGAPTLMKFTAQTSGNVNNIIAQVVVAGATLTSSQNYAAIFNASGTQLGITADQTTAWGSTGLKTMALTAPAAVVAGLDYFVVLLSNGTTPPKFAQGATSVQAANSGLAASVLRFSTNSSAQTSMPASLTPASNTGTNAVTVWTALS